MGIGGLFMKSEFQTMTLGELRQYVLEHRNDQLAFEALMERINAQPQPQQQVYGEVDAGEFRDLVQQYRDSKSQLRG
ncbi:MAG: hypothetical protein F6K30_03430 [Cyanothece sp. SIO2G6]|nr:hypothetical protein [Cyanothece sp. SIO2G6]